MSIVEAVENSCLNNEQKVLAIVTDSVYPSLWIYSKSARIINVNNYKAMKYSFNQMKELIQKTLLTDKKKGRASNDKCAL